MTAIQATYKLAMAAGRDAGNRSMKKAGRTRWAEQDMVEAENTFYKVMGTTPEKAEKDLVR